MSIRFLSEANADVGEALAWLVGRRRYRGVTDLWAEWQTGLSAIEAAPQLYPSAADAPAGREVRAYPTRRHGYLIVYEVIGTGVVIVAFVRARRHPRAWLGRLSP